MVAVSPSACAYLSNYWVSLGHVRCTSVGEQMLLTVWHMLCDITIYYNCMKMLCSHWMLPLPPRRVYGSVCPLFGVWHVYKYCVDHTYNAFLPFVVACECKGFLQNPDIGQLYAPSFPYR